MSGQGPSLDLPKHYGKYELLERIGSGGMAEVYRARLGGIAGFAKTVVIKRLHPKHASQLEFVQLFVEEAKLAAEVQHKNVVNVFDLGSLESGEVYMAMEYVDGTDLKNLLRTANQAGRRLPPWLSVHVVAEVLEALGFAHDLTDERGFARNIVHCDVTPENVFLGRSGEVKLGDFGVARDDARVSEPFEGSVRGKVPYMSPEQVQGHKPDRRSDIFAAGIVLWECLTQRRLFSAPDHPETVRKILFAPRIPPSHLVADIPPELDAIVLDALRVEHDRRIPDARTMQRRLLDLLERLRPRRTLTDVRESFMGLFSNADFEITSPGDLEIIDLDSDAILEDVPDTEIPPASSDDAARRLARNGLEQPSGLRVMSQAPVSLVSNPSQPRMRAPASNPSQPRMQAPAKGTQDLTPGSSALSAWLALGGDPSHPPPRMPPPLSGRLQGPTSGVETRDILRRLPDRGPVPERRGPTASELLPGAPITAEPPPRVDTSADRHPLWVRAPDGTVMGPHGPASALDAIRSLLDGAPAPTVSLSADRKRWLSADRLAPLIGEAPTAAPCGQGATKDGATNVADYSLTALFGHLTRTGQTGRLIVERPTAKGHLRWELSLDGGRLVSVSSSTDPFETWIRALGAGSPSHKLKACLHRVIQQIQPLSTVATPDDLAQLKPHRIAALQSQLHELFSVDEGTVWMERESSPPASLGSPIALLRLLPAVVSRARRSQQLRLDLVRYLDVALVRSARFDAETRGLELPAEDQVRLEPFGHGHTLARTLSSCQTSRDEKLGLVLAYLLTELDLLMPFYQGGATGSLPGTGATHQY